MQAVRAPAELAVIIRSSRNGFRGNHLAMQMLVRGRTGRCGELPQDSVNRVIRQASDVASGVP
jgi:hypothetical protein